MGRIVDFMENNKMQVKSSIQMILQRKDYLTKMKKRKTFRRRKKKSRKFAYVGPREKARGFVIKRLETVDFEFP